MADLLFLFFIAFSPLLYLSRFNKESTLEGIERERERENPTKDWKRRDRGRRMIEKEGCWCARIMVAKLKKKERKGKGWKEEKQARTLFYSRSKKIEFECEFRMALSGLSLVLSFMSRKLVM